MRVTNGIAKVYLLAFTSLQKHRFLLAFYLYDTLLFRTGFILHGNFHIDCSLIGLNLRCRHEYTILSNMHRGHGFKPHMAIDARTAIPTAVGLFTVVYFHYDLILPLAFK